MGLFDDLLTPAPGAAPQPRLGLFDDLLRPDHWQQQAPPSEPPEDPGLGFGAFARLAGSEAISGVPRLAGMIDSATDWLSRPPAGPDDLAGAARLGLASTPIGLALRVGKAARDVAGVTGAVETSNEAIDALQEQERERLRNSPLGAVPLTTPLGAIPAESIAIGAGMVADPINLAGTMTLARGGKAAVKALPETWSPLKRFLLQDLAGGAERTAVSLADEAAEGALPAAAKVEPPAIVNGVELPPDVPPPTKRVDRDPFFDRTAEPATPVPDETPEILGRESIAYLSDGTPVRTRWVLRDADTVETSHTDAFTPNARYPHDSGAQPRDLARPAEQQKIHQIRRDYNPDLIGPSNFLSDGAGTFARQESGRPYLLVGNSRTMAQRQALEQPEILGKQLEALGRQNREYGFPDDFIEQAQTAGMRKPAAFREVLDEIDPAHLGREGNVATIGSLSDVDIAAADARRLTPELLDLAIDGAPLDSAGNRDFVRSFLATVVPEREHGPLMGPHGELAASGERRIQNALLSAAYRDPDAVSRLIEAEAEGIRNVGRGMVASAGRFARLAARAERGEVFARDIGQDVAMAAKKLAELRGKGMAVEMYLRQTGLFGHELTPEARQLLAAWQETARDRSAPAGILRRYADLVESFGDPRQGSLLGAAEAPSKAEILEEAIRTCKASEEPLLFPGGATGLVAGIADALPGPLGAVVRHFDLSKLKGVARRWLSNFGDVDALGKIAPEVAERIRLSAAERSAHEARAAMNLLDYDVALKRFQRRLSEAGIHRSEDEISQEVLAGLLGESDLAGLAPELQEIATRMRAQVDELTGGILNNQELTKDLRYTLEKNLGAYLRRSYEIHRDPSAWQKVVKEQEPWRWEGAKQWVGEQHPQWTDDEIEGYLNSYFVKQPEAATAIAPRSSVFRFDKGLFKHRIRQQVVHIEGEAARTYPTKEAANRAAEAPRLAGKKVTVTEEQGLPKALEDFLGLHTDPRARYAESVATMAHDLETAKLLSDIRALGENTIFHRARAGAFAAQVHGDPRFNPLAGMWTTPEVRAVLDALSQQTAAPPWLQKVMAANALVRAGKTVGSPLTHVRNFLSWNFMLLSNGHFSSAVNVPRLWKATKVVGSPKLSMQGRVHRGIESLADALETVGGEKLSSVFRFDLPSLRKEYERGVRLGILGEGRGQELARYLGLVAETKTAGRLAETKVGKGAGWVAGKARELYAGEDDVGKMVAWLAERANYQKAFPEMSADEIAELTAPLVRDLYPTYSKAPRAVREVRDFPFFGDFPTFYAEVVRTSKNTLKRGAWELAQIQTNPRLAWIGAKRLAGFGSAIASVAAIGAAARARLGISAEEMAAARESAPEWNRNADLIPVEKKGDGKYSVIDASYINPYAMFREAWTALTANGYRWDERIEGILDELSAPFVDEGMLTRLAIDLSRNRSEFGRKVYPDFGTLEEKASAISKYAGTVLQPGIVSQSQDLYSGVTGELNPRTGRAVDVETLAWSWLTGTRQLEIDVPKRLAGAVRGLQRARSEIVGEWNRAQRDSGGPTPELLEQKASANAQWKEVLRAYRRKVDAARATGLSDYQIRKILTAADIGKPTIDALMGGYDFEVAK